MNWFRIYFKHEIKWRRNLDNVETRKIEMEKEIRRNAGHVEGRQGESNKFLLSHLSFKIVRP